MTKSPDGKGKSRFREICDLANEASEAKSWKEFREKARKLDEAAFPSLKKEKEGRS